MTKTKKTEWKKPREIEYLVPREDRYYIFCEGEQTEPKYFNGFKKCISFNWNFTFL